MAPSVSVVIPTFGRPQLLTRAIESVLRQTVQDIEVIVVIDGIDDATISAIEALGDPRVRTILHDSKQGAGKSRDDGANSSRGRWVAFLDDDDEWLPEKLARQLAIARPDTIIACRTRVVTPQGDFVRPNNAYDGSIPFDEWMFDRHTWFKENDGFLQTSSLLIPRELIVDLKFKTAKHEEWELIIRATKEYNYKLAISSGVDVIYYAGSTFGSLSKSYTWPSSVAWADELGNLMTPRAYAGFCLVTAARMAADARDFSAIGKLLSAARKRGKPTFKQLFAFGLIWLFPTPIRLRIRNALRLGSA
ncbi:glycosyltransferase family 2 protein [Bosea sp. BH3]|uniref:glycosyltransferase family 2 protein n=1 Tax=Bosea sp. BH3 TaxID=2871701 RepID=UPI0021CB36E4|nr:glycosyltransferase family 2 protein [Bosea sp. BH3]MCU4181153.1 glycosyltransferase [Bosea sp. BH3]